MAGSPVCRAAQPMGLPVALGEAFHQADGPARAASKIVLRENSRRKVWDVVTDNTVAQQWNERTTNVGCLYVLIQERTNRTRTERDSLIPKGRISKGVAGWGTTAR